MTVIIVQAGLKAVVKSKESGHYYQLLDGDTAVARPVGPFKIREVAEKWAEKAVRQAKQEQIETCTTNSLLAVQQQNLIHEKSAPSGM
jgi:hypothetical protein